MSHDRGCPCGKERYEYKDCELSDCYRKEKRMAHYECKRCHQLPDECECSVGEEPVNTEFVNDRQIGGLHYRSKYQHWDWSIDTNLGPIEYAATKYVSRWWKKHGPVKGIEDIEKAKHYVEKIKSAHSEGRYQTAISRIGKRNDAVLLTMKFGNENELTEHESVICWKLAVWETTEDLDEVLRSIDNILLSPKKALNGRAAVNHTKA